MTMTPKTLDNNMMKCVESGGVKSSWLLVVELEEKKQAADEDLLVVSKQPI